MLETDTLLHIRVCRQEQTRTGTDQGIPRRKKEKKVTGWNRNSKHEKRKTRGGDTSVWPCRGTSNSFSTAASPASVSDESKQQY